MTIFRKPGIEMKDSFAHSPYLLESKLNMAISVGDIFESTRILKLINQNPRASLAKSLTRSVKNSVICSVCLFARAAINAGLNDDLVYSESDDLINGIEELDEIEKVNLLEYTALNTFATMVRDMLHVHYSAIIVKSMQVIKTNLNSRLGLSIVSDIVGVSSSYLSDLFKKETGKTISKYINEAKVVESVFFLKNTPQTISEISDYYYFANVSYYIKQFRNIYGITPNQFRERQ